MTYLVFLSSFFLLVSFSFFQFFFLGRVRPWTGVFGLVLFFTVFGYRIRLRFDVISFPMIFSEVFLRASAFICCALLCVFCFSGFGGTFLLFPTIFSSVACHDLCS